jgi:hypothetical protein
VDFSIDELLDVDSNVNAGTSLKSYDLAASAGSAWKQRKHISSVSVQAASATVTAVNAGNTATTVSGEVWLLPEGASSPSAAGAVKVGEWTGEPVTLNHMIDLAVTPALETFVRDLFDGSGVFSVYASGAGAGGARVAVTLHVVVDAKLKWKPF